MSRKLFPILLLVLPLVSAPGQAQQPAGGRAPDCSDLVWSAQVLAANPDIDASCQGVYQRGDELYARVEITLTRVRGNRITFRPRHVNGGEGAARSIVVPGSWRASIDGREYRARDLLPGQQLSVFIPEDRFALALGDDTLTRDDDPELIDIEEAAVVPAMPRTASPLTTAFGAGLVLFTTGLLLRQRRARKSS